MNAPVICDCGLIPLPVGVFTEYRHGVDHSETACIPSPVVVVDAPTLAEGLGLLRAAVARQLDVEQVGRAS